MARMRYCCSFDERGAGASIRTSTVSSGSLLDADGGGANVQSRYGVEKNIVEAFNSTVAAGAKAPTLRYQSYNWWVEFNDITASTTTDLFIGPTSNHGGPTTGDVGIGFNFDTTANTIASLGIYVYSGGWNLLLSSGSVSIGEGEGPTLLTLEVDNSSKRARILRDGAVFSGDSGAGDGWNSSASIAGTHPTSFGAWVNQNVSAPKHNGADVEFWLSSMFVIESDDADLDLSPLTGLASYEVYAYYPRSDVSVGDWTTTGISAPCDGDRWRAVDDAESEVAGGSDSISEAVAGTSDILFEVPDIPASATVLGAALVAHGGSGSNLDTMLDGLVKYSGTTDVEAMSVAGGGGYHCVAILDDAPGGVAWSETIANAVQIGVRAKASQAPVVGVLFIDFLGTGLARHSTAPACSSGVTRRRAGVVLGSSNCGIY